MNAYDVMAIPSDLVKKFAASLGYDPMNVRAITVTPHEVTVLTYARDSKGNIKIEPGYTNKLMIERHVHWVQP